MFHKMWTLTPDLIKFKEVYRSAIISLIVIGRLFWATLFKFKFQDTCLIALVSFGYNCGQQAKNNLTCAFTKK